MAETLNVEEFKAFLDEVFDNAYGQKHGYTKEQANDVALNFLSQNIALIKELKPGRLNQIKGQIESGGLNTGENQADGRVIDILNTISDTLNKRESAPNTNSEAGADVININRAAREAEIRRDSEQSLSRLVTIKLINDLDFNSMDIAFIQKKKNENGYPQNLSEKRLTTDESNKMFEAIQTKIRRYEDSQKTQPRRAA